MIRTNLIYFIAFLVLNACSGNANKETSEKSEKVDELKDLARMNFMALKAPQKKNSDEAKVVLGKKIFFEKGLSSDNSTSCNSCHDMSNYGVDNLALSDGAEGGNTQRNSPTVLNVHMHIAQFWDGRAATLREQIRMPIMANGEMSMPDEGSIVEALNRLDGYQEMFAAIPSYSDEITIEDMSDAVATYIESMVFPSKFDKYLSDDSFQLDQNELVGLRLFMDRGCTDCHQGKLLGGDGFERFGIFDQYWKYTGGTQIDSGKYLISNNSEDMFVFKVPSLRNVDKTYPYFHDGSVSELDQAIKIMGKLQLDEEIGTNEASDIAAFLGTLTSEIPQSNVTASLK